MIKFYMKEKSLLLIQKVKEKKNLLQSIITKLFAIIITRKMESLKSCLLNAQNLSIMNL